MTQGSATRHHSVITFDKCWSKSTRSGRSANSTVRRETNAVFIVLSRNWRSLQLLRFES